MQEQPVNECPAPNGILVIVGGKENKGEKPTKEIQKKNSEPLEILNSFLEVIGKENPAIGVVTTASSQPAEMFEDYQKAFALANVENVRHIHHENRDEVLNDDNSWIRELDAVFFSGGNQLKLTSFYGGTNALLNLKQRYINDGLVIGGTSAGAMAMSTPMIYAGNQQVQQITGEIKVTTGLEFLKDVCVDTHFVDRGRVVRMAQVIATNPTCIGIGIEEDTAIIVRNGIEAEVAGSGIVIMIEGHNIRESNVLDFGLKGAISIRNLSTHLLSKGDKFIIPQNNPPHI
ncbi:cyanophycinase [Pedobacter sp. SYSU D00535]|uniref:cyanophycinase n=1 Tax=Pedobacter sp. SYSU D00535 TaxID=2810308 RepID=UPI001A96F271|nr:cyanophycinase [Pedobacter sp. SYSU D00535]